MLLTEALGLVVTNRVYEIVHELLRRDVANAQVVIASFDRMPAGMHQMRLAQTHTAVQVKWVVGPARSFSNSHRRCVSKLIARPDDKTFICVLGAKRW